ncbi:MAG: hypothetical protein Q7T20_17495 [Saprospiraceae bacterium]|nr:hypothetical protein [Saprospiraceae bacterium]
MISRTKTSFVWLWTAALLSASVGVSVQQVYCYCVGKTTVSLFAADDACQANHDDVAPSLLSEHIGTGCCAKKVASAKRACCEKPDSDKKGCTKKTTKVFQLKTEFEVANSEFKKFDAPKSWSTTPSFLAFSSAILGPQKIDLQGFKRPPPSLSGRMICVRHGVFRC